MSTDYAKEKMMQMAKELGLSPSDVDEVLKKLHGALDFEKIHQKQRELAGIIEAQQECLRKTMAQGGRKTNGTIQFPL